LNPPARHTDATLEAAGHIPLPNPVKQKIKDGMVALTMAAWCFVRPWSHLLFGANSYFNKLPVARVELLASAVTILGFALVLWLGMRVWRHCRTGTLSLLLDMSFLFLLVFPADFIRLELLNVVDTKLVAFMRQPAVVACFFVLLVVLIWQRRLAARAAAMMLVITFPVVLLTMAKIVLLCLGVLPVKACAYSPPPPPIVSMRAGQQRVVWMIFDETDYRLVFEKRPADAPLLEFDRLRQTALCADHAYAPADWTIISMPALISGRLFSAAVPGGCDLDLTVAGTGATVEWSALPSVFSQARELGVNTALVGWYHPYARELGGSLNYCSWYPFPAFAPARSTTFGGALEQQIASLAGPFHIRQVFINTCKDSLADAVATVTNPGYGLVFLHLPPPHGPGVYLPEENEFTCNGIAPPAGYFNNLVLADHQLGVLRHEMETSGQWDTSWVILSADHSWRKSKMYDGIRDYRVPFLVKSPGQTESISYSHQFNTVLTHDLVLSILRGEVTNQAGAEALLDQGKPDMPAARPEEGAD
jgi:hypothetical protein